MTAGRTKGFQARIGREFAFHCTICEGATLHRVTYVQGSVHHLRCLSCKKVQAYLLEEEGGVEGLKAKLLDHEALMQQRSSHDARPYLPKDLFVAAEFIEHKTFGAGYVLNVHWPPVKMSVLFAEKTRVLVCGGSTGPELEPGATSGPSDFARPDSQTPTGSGPGNEKAGVSGDKTVTCPKCGKNLHTHNLHRTPAGKIVGCMYCG